MKIIVTGGASGVGAALVERLAEHEVWILDVQSPSGLADGHCFIPLDLSDAQAIDRVVADLPDALDGLANVAGIAQAPQPQTVVAVNFLGLRHLTESLIPRLVPGGRVVNVSSIAGRDWQSRVQWLLPLLETNSFAEGMNWCQEHPEGLGLRRCIQSSSPSWARRKATGPGRRPARPNPMTSPRWWTFCSLAIAAG